MTQQEARRADVEDRLRRYHGVTLEQVLEVIAYLRDDDDSLIAGGSLALGLGNQRSDLDVVVCGESTESTRVPLEHWVESLRVDVWRRAQRDIDEVFERAASKLNDEAPFADAFGDLNEQTELKLLHRIAFGLVLDGPPLVPTSTRDYEAIAIDLVVREYAERMRDVALVAQLAADAGDSIAASFSARLAVEAALQAAMTARGLTFTGDKWLRERLRRDLPDLRSVYEPFAVLPDVDEDAGEFVRSAVETCQRLTGQDLSLASQSELVSFRNSDLQLMDVGPDHFLLSTAEGGLWELDETEVEAWRGLDGSGTWGLDALDAEQARLCYRLYAKGLVKPVWERGLPIDELELERAVGA